MGVFILIHAKACSQSFFGVTPGHSICGVAGKSSLCAKNIPAQRRYKGAFTFDTERGIVRFAEPVMQVNPGGASGFAEAELYLTIAHGV